MIRQACLLGACFAFAFASTAATPPPDKLLAADTLAMITVPDYAKAKATTHQWPLSQLWADPAMKPFADKFITKFKSELVEPVEREFGLKFADYAGFAQGQVTLALTLNTSEGK